MGKTLLYIVILGLLGFAVYYFLFAEHTDTPYSADEAGFTVADTGAIGKFFIVSNTGQSVLVERSDKGGWTVNKQYKALQSAVDIVFQTISQQKVLYPVTKTAYENVVKSLSTEGTKVELYDRSGKKTKVFYVGGPAVNNNGTNMIIEGAKMPYVVTISGFNGALTSRFQTDMRFWRDRTIFSIPGDELQSVSVQYEGKPINSFTITRVNDTDVAMTADAGIAAIGAFNKRRAKVYLRYFANVNCEGYLNGLSDMDTTLKTAPKQSTIEIVGKHGQRQRADIYWMAINKRSKNRSVADPDIPDDYDADRLYAVINDNKDTVMIQQWAFRDIFHKAYEFYQKDVTPVIPERPKNVLMHKDR